VSFNKDRKFRYIQKAPQAAPLKTSTSWRCSVRRRTQEKPPRHYLRKCHLAALARSRLSQIHCRKCSLPSRWRAWSRPSISRKPRRWRAISRTPIKWSCWRDGFGQLRHWPVLQIKASIR